MKTRYLLLLVMCAVALESFAQNPTKAKALYDSGKYAEAKSELKKLVKAQPANGNYNLWYGVACMKTGETKEAINYLKTAVRRRATGGQFYLAQAYDQAYLFEEAVSTCEEYISELEKRRRSTENAEKELDKFKVHLRMMKGVEKVCVIDSIVVDKQHFLEAYKISPEAGKLATYASYFGEGGQGGTVYETELGDRLYYSKRQEDGTLDILSCAKIQGEWANGHRLPESINGAVNADYPYVMTDGVTIYYAADGKGSMGGYDIFVTRYNTDTDTYLTPENIGMPFNSPYNDYMYVVDEFNNLGWFASDRFQPADKVCVYVFVPNPSKQVYNYEGMDRQALTILAMLSSIAATQTDYTVVAAAKERLAGASATFQADAENERKHDFEFVIDDRHVYHMESDFRSAEAKVSFRQWRMMEQNLQQQTARLDQMRKQYAEADGNGKVELAPALLDLEKRIKEMDHEQYRLVKQIRRQEKETINNK